MRLIYFNLLNMEKFETEYKGKLGKKDKGINIPCLAFKNKKNLIKISKENKFIIDETLKLNNYRFKLLLKFAKKKEIDFNYSNIDSRKYLETILPCFPHSWHTLKSSLGVRPPMHCVQIFWHHPPSTTDWSVSQVATLHFTQIPLLS